MTAMVSAAPDDHWPDNHWRDAAAFIGATTWVSGLHVIDSTTERRIEIDMLPAIMARRNLVSAIVVVSCEQNKETDDIESYLKGTASLVGPHVLVLRGPRGSRCVSKIMHELHDRIDGPVLYVGYGRCAIHAIELSTQLENSSALGINPLSFSSGDETEYTALNLADGSAGLRRPPRILAVQSTAAGAPLNHVSSFLDRGGFVHRGNGLYVNEHSQAFVLAGSLATGGEAFTHLIQYLIPGVSDLSRSPRSLYNDIVEQKLIPHEFSTLPMDLRDLWDSGSLPTQVRFYSDERETVVEVSLIGRPKDYGALRIEASIIRNGESLVLEERASGHFHGPGVADSAQVCFTDGFGHVLGTKYVSASAAPPAEPKIFILGSCVSRDAFDLDGSPELVDYRARTALGSAFAARTDFMNDVNLELNASAFQRRMVKTDLEKRLGPLLAESTFDFLLLDLIDERLQLIRHASSYVTFSPELQTCRVAPCPSDLVEVGSPEYFEAFMEGLEKLLAIVPADKIIVNEVYWAENSLDGSPVGSVAQTTKHNRVLRLLYRELRRRPGLHFITYDRSMFVSDERHKWGPSPFHFASELYQQTLRGIERVAAGEQ